MMKKMYPVIHFELPAKDTKRAGKFYADAFGWEITPLGPEMGDFTLAFTTATDTKSRMPEKAGAINGGFYKKTGRKDQTKVTILVDDMRRAIERVEGAGGKFVPGPNGDTVMDMPGLGLFATFTDPEGNAVQLYEDRTPNPTPSQQALLG